jgi:hypothetical protein
MEILGEGIRQAERKDVLEVLDRSLDPACAGVPYILPQPKAWAAIRPTRWRTMTTERLFEN